MARSAEPCELTASTVVSCSVQQCWGLYINNALMPEWAPTVSQVDCEHAFIDIDVMRKCVSTVNNKQGHTLERCTLFEPLKRIEFEVVEETFGFSHMLNSYGARVSFDVEGANTLLIMQTYYVPKKIFASVMSSNTTQQPLVALMTEALQGFKHFAESRSDKSLLA